MVKYQNCSLVQSNDNADCVAEDDRFEYIDDLSVLQILCLSGLLVDYDFHSHVGIDQNQLCNTESELI